MPDGWKLEWHRTTPDEMDENYRWTKQCEMNGNSNDWTMLDNLKQQW